MTKEQLRELAQRAKAAEDELLRLKSSSKEPTKSDTSERHRRENTLVCALADSVGLS